MKQIIADIFSFHFHELPENEQERIRSKLDILRHEAGNYSRNNGVTVFLLSFVLVLITGYNFYNDFAVGFISGFMSVMLISMFLKSYKKKAQLRATVYMMELICICKELRMDKETIDTTIRAMGVMLGKDMMSVVDEALSHYENIQP